MTKIQKMWLWISVAMFFIPEILFSFITSWIPGMSQLTNNHFFYEYFIDPQYFVDNPIFLFFALGIEFLGALLLLIWNIKFNRSKYKVALTIIAILILIFLAFIFFVGYSVSNMSFP